MDLQHVLQQYLTWVPSRSTAEIDAEIREELQFHLDMRVQDNLSAGMSPEEALRDAQRRFGDFETNHRKCRKITLGPRLMLQRLQTGLLVVLISIVIYQGVVLVQVQTSSRDQIESLTRTVERLHAARKSVTNEAATMPYMRWNQELTGEIDAATDKTNPNELAGWKAADNPIQQPWCDWLSLDDKTKLTE